MLLSHEKKKRYKLDLGFWCVTKHSGDGVPAARQYKYEKVLQVNMLEQHVT